ncbi:beta-ketoacyl-ACP synthase II [Geofilum rhodophaeum]|uniref:beta-ketoacyl-ACP synthase II n=1 Tax=Geofilum rhodophaeum TaxID=1965019 RepID=UPI000B521BC9|nr:beta-ketoacyl-ACP synthase II [Geofilum rhodophaeum]
MELKRVVVTGLGAITPLGNSVETYWENLIKGVSGAGPITRFDATNFKTKFACEVKDFDPTEYLDRKEVRKMDLFAQYAMGAAEQAIQDSGLNLETLDPDEAGVIWGAGIGGIITFMDEVKAYVEGNGTPRFSPFFIPKMISDIAAGHISMKYGFRGPNYATVSACASSSHAIADAFNHIRMGKAKVFITGGSEAAINEAGVGGFNSMQAMSTFNEDPSRASRPFDKERDGFVIGEGGGALILEEYEHALARGAKIYCEVAGAGMTADAHHLTAPHPDGLGAAKVMQATLKDGNIDMKDVDYINVHGTATPRGDIAEILAIEKVFGDHAFELNISATKSMTGHLLGAAGAIESIAAILAINNGIVPPTINHNTPDPEINSKLNLTLNKAQERKVKVALSNTFGFGGHNASVAFKAIE